MTDKTTDALPDRIDKGQTIAGLRDSEKFGHVQRIAKMFAASALVPKHFQGQVAECTIALQVAEQMNLAPLSVMQNLYVVHGQPAWSSAFLKARAHQSGAFRGKIRYREEGTIGAADYVVTAVATDAETGEELTAMASMAMAKAEGWTNNSKYQTMPQRMLRYRAATFLVRDYAPEVLFGIPVADELEDVAIAAEYTVKEPDSVAKVNAEIAGERGPAEPNPERDGKAEGGGEPQAQPEGAGAADAPGAVAPAASTDDAGDATADDLAGDLFDGS